MKICILGNGLVSLTLAKALINYGIYVDIFSDRKSKLQSGTRTLGISQNNINFLNKEILEIEKFLWKINQIEIYSENLNNEKLLNFENKDENLFSMIKNHELKNYLFSELKQKIDIPNLEEVLLI